jgi:hypothetical protein
MTTTVTRTDLFIAFDKAEAFYTAAFEQDKLDHETTVSKAYKDYQKRLKERKDALKAEIARLLAAPIVIRDKFLWFKAKTRTRTQEEAESDAKAGLHRLFYPMGPFQKPKLYSSNQHRLTRVQEMRAASLCDGFDTFTLPENDMVLLSNAEAIAEATPEPETAE